MVRIILPLLKTSVCSLKRPSPSFRRPLRADNSLLGVLHHLLHRHNARSCCEYLQQNCKHSFKLYQKIRHQIRMNAPHHPVFRYGLTPWGLSAMITRSSGMLVGEVLTVESVLLTIAVRIVLIRVALQTRGGGGLCQEQQQGGTSMFSGTGTGSTTSASTLPPGRWPCTGCWVSAITASIW